MNQDPANEISPLPVEDVARHAKAILAEVGTVIVGMESTLRTALSTILAGGHVLFDDVPGVGKTVAARSLATALGLDFGRLQCTPDLLPADITGSYIYDPAETRFVFRRGPIFCGLLLADEINRTPPKTQSALLEAMAERQVTVEGNSFTLAAPFHVIATSNPVEYEGTYPLPEAQLDRFMTRVAVGYLERDSEIDVLSRRVSRRTEETRVNAVVDAGIVLSMQAGVEAVAVDHDIVGYCIDLAKATRSHSEVEVGVSPRGAQMLMLVARAMAVVSGRGYVTPEDVKEVAVSVLAHRLTLTPQSWAAGTDPTAIVASLLDHVPGPAVVRTRSGS